MSDTSILFDNEHDYFNTTETKFLSKSKSQNENNDGNKVNSPQQEQQSNTTSFLNDGNEVSSPQQEQQSQTTSFLTTKIQTLTETKTKLTEQLHRITEQTQPNNGKQNTSINNLSGEALNTELDKIEKKAKAKLQSLQDKNNKYQKNDKIKSALSQLSEVTNSDYQINPFSTHSLFLQTVGEKLAALENNITQLSQDKAFVTDKVVDPNTKKTYSQIIEKADQKEGIYHLLLHVNETIRSPNQNNQNLKDHFYAKNPKLENIRKLADNAQLLDQASLILEIIKFIQGHAPSSKLAEQLNTPKFNRILDQDISAIRKDPFNTAHTKLALLNYIINDYSQLTPEKQLELTNQIQAKYNFSIEQLAEKCTSKNPSPQVLELINSYQNNSNFSLDTSQLAKNMFDFWNSCDRQQKIQFINDFNYAFKNQTPTVTLLDTGNFKNIETLQSYLDGYVQQHQTYQTLILNKQHDDLINSNPTNKKESEESLVKLLLNQSEDYPEFLDFVEEGISNNIVKIGNEIKESIIANLIASIETIELKKLKLLPSLPEDTTLRQDEVTLLQNEVTLTDLKSKIETLKEEAKQIHINYINQSFKTSDQKEKAKLKEAYELNLARNDAEIKKTEAKLTRLTGFTNLDDLTNALTVAKNKKQLKALDDKIAKINTTMNHLIPDAQLTGLKDNITNIETKKQELTKDCNRELSKNWDQNIRSSLIKQRDRDIKNADSELQNAITELENFENEIKNDEVLKTIDAIHDTIVRLQHYKRLVEQTDQKIKNEALKPQLSKANSPLNRLRGQRNSYVESMNKLDRELQELKINLSGDYGINIDGQLNKLSAQINATKTIENYRENKKFELPVVKKQDSNEPTTLDDDAVTTIAEISDIENKIKEIRENKATKSIKESNQNLYLNGFNTQFNNALCQLEDLATTIDNTLYILSNAPVFVESYNQLSSVNQNLKLYHDIKSNFDKIITYINNAKIEQKNKTLFIDELNDLIVNSDKSKDDVLKQTTQILDRLFSVQTQAKAFFENINTGGKIFQNRELVDKYYTIANDGKLTPKDNQPIKANILLEEGNLPFLAPIYNYNETSIVKYILNGDDKASPNSQHLANHITHADKLLDFYALIYGNTASNKQTIIDNAQFIVDYFVQDPNCLNNLKKIESIGLLAEIYENLQNQSQNQSKISQYFSQTEYSELQGIYDHIKQVPKDFQDTVILQTLNCCHAIITDSSDKHKKQSLCNLKKLIGNLARTLTENKSQLSQDEVQEIIKNYDKISAPDELEANVNAYKKYTTIIENNTSHFESYKKHSLIGILTDKTKLKHINNLNAISDALNPQSITLKAKATTFIESLKKTIYTKITPETNLSELATQTDQINALIEKVIQIANITEFQLDYINKRENSISSFLEGEVNEVSLTKANSLANAVLTVAKLNQQQQKFIVEKVISSVSNFRANFSTEQLDAVYKHLNSNNSTTTNKFIEFLINDNSHQKITEQFTNSDTLFDKLSSALETLNSDYPSLANTIAKGSLIKYLPNIDEDKKKIEELTQAIETINTLSNKETGSANLLKGIIATEIQNQKTDFDKIETKLIAFNNVLDKQNQIQHLINHYFENQVNGFIKDYIKTYGTEKALNLKTLDAAYEQADYIAKIKSLDTQLRKITQHYENQLTTNLSTGNLNAIEEDNKKLKGILKAINAIGLTHQNQSEIQKILSPLVCNLIEANPDIDPEKLNNAIDSILKFPNIEAAITNLNNNQITTQVNDFITKYIKTYDDTNNALTLNLNKLTQASEQLTEINKRIKKIEGNKGYNNQNTYCAEKIIISYFNEYKTSSIGTNLHTLHRIHTLLTDENYQSYFNNINDFKNAGFDTIAANYCKNIQIALGAIGNTNNQKFSDTEFDTRSNNGDYTQRDNRLGVTTLRQLKANYDELTNTIKPNERGENKNTALKKDHQKFFNAVCDDLKQQKTITNYAFENFNNVVIKNPQMFRTLSDKFDDYNAVKNACASSLAKAINIEGSINFNNDKAIQIIESISSSFELIDNQLKLYKFNNKYAVAQILDNLKKEVYLADLQNKLQQANQGIKQLVKNAYLEIIEENAQLLGLNINTITTTLDNATNDDLKTLDAILKKINAWNNNSVDDKKLAAAFILQLNYLFETSDTQLFSKLDTIHKRMKGQIYAYKTSYDNDTAAYQSQKTNLTNYIEKVQKRGCPLATSTDLKSIVIADAICRTTTNSRQSIESQIASSINNISQKYDKFKGIIGDVNTFHEHSNNHSSKKDKIVEVTKTIDTAIFENIAINREKTLLKKPTITAKQQEDLKEHKGFFAKILDFFGIEAKSYKKFNAIFYKKETEQVNGFSPKKESAPSP
ncbi:hypothetical protein L3V82_02710 [Thiotrichales bacterium 19S3-7]|nr:hypothetical protein [Thiotrichales bacterium 19S3-7]MCF6801080.1 hypothetical protein [Thiotrichales bacterium 19S3-11]